MALNNSNVHPEYNPDIKIKAEPGTVLESAQTPNLEIPSLIKNIKTESGVPATTTASPSNRLTSFRVPRDLTLGGNKVERPKKNYTPNLNVQRIKNREDQNSTKQDDASQKSRSGRNRDRTKNDRGREKGRGREKAASNLIQSSGIFSEGLANLSTKKYSGGVGGFRDRDNSAASERETTATLERPKLSIPQKVDKAEEAEKLRELLRDDFLDDGQDLDLENTPISLPMIDHGKLFKREINQKPQLVSYKGVVENTVQMQNGDVKAQTQDQKKLMTPQMKMEETKLACTVPQVLENKPNTFILIQLPDCLPGLRADEMQRDPRCKKTSEPSPEVIESDKLSQFCTLNSLKEGMLGKLQILRSGKARLVLGDNNLVVDIGSNMSFRQDLIATNISEDKQRGDLVNLGSVNSTLICSPDWENMLKIL